MTRDATVKVYDPTGVTLLATLERVWGVRWTDERNGPGRGQFTIHGGDAQATEALLQDRNVVKFTYEGAERSGFVIQSRRRVHVSSDEGVAEVITVSGPGLAWLLASGMVFGEFGTTRRSADSRNFSYGSLAGEWRDPAEWAAPVATASSADARTAQVVNWPDDGAPYWIWPTDGSIDVTAGLIAFFRRTFTVATEIPVVLFVTGDDSVELKLDGETIIPLSSVESRSWKVTKRYETILSVGTHVLAARVDNQAVYDSPSGLLLSLHQMDADGEIASTILVSDSAWECRPGPTVPGWSKANVARALFVENRDTYGVENFSAVTLSIGPTVDGDGVAWESNHDMDRGFPLGMSYLDVLTQLSEHGGFDWHVGPDMHLRGWIERGSASGVTLARAVNLLGYETESTSLQATRLLIRTRDGFLVVNNPTAETAHGTHLAFLSLGEVEDDVTATAIGTETLATYAFPQAVYSAEVAVLPGAVPYVDYDVGDTVTGPAEWTGTATLRIQALSMVEDADGRMRPVPEFQAV